MAYPFFCLISPLPLFLGLGLRLGAEGPPLFLDQKEARRAETIFFLGLLATKNSVIRVVRRTLSLLTLIM